jgi:hypothetical protein
MCDVSQFDPVVAGADTIMQDSIWYGINLTDLHVWTYPLVYFIMNQQEIELGILHARKTISAGQGCRSADTTAIVIKKYIYALYVGEISCAN